MAEVIKNDASVLQPAGSMLTMTIDNTNNEVETDVAAFSQNDAQWWQLQVRCVGGANFTIDGSDPTSGTVFKADDEFSVVWSRETLRVSRWSRASTSNGTLVIQPLEA